MKWKNININKNNIEYETGRAVLIKMPHSSDYDGFKFWHPSKLVREGRNDGAVSIGYTEEFTFRLFKNGNGKHNSREIVAEETIDASEFELAFGRMDECIEAPKKDTESYVEVNEPEFKTPKETKVADELSL